MSMNLDPQLVRKIAREHILSRRLDIGTAVIKHFGSGTLGDEEFEAWYAAVDADVRQATRTVLWPDGQAQDASVEKFQLGHGGAYCAFCRKAMREGAPVVCTTAVVCTDCAPWQDDEAQLVPRVTCWDVFTCQDGNRFSCGLDAGHGNHRGDGHEWLKDHSDVLPEGQAQDGRDEGSAFQAEHAVELVAALVDPACQTDGYGNCATHSVLALEAGGQCPHVLARAFLAGAGPSRREWQDGRDADVRAVAALLAVASREYYHGPADEDLIAALGDVRDRFADRIAALDPVVLTRTPEQWCARYGVEIRDPDGWRSAGDPAWDEPITLPDFWRRAAVSTVRNVGSEGWKRVSRDAAELDARDAKAGG